MYRNRDGVAGHVVEPVLVEVVADAGPVREQMLHGDVVGDLGQVVAKERPGGGRQVEPALLHERHHGQRGEPLRGTGGPELRIDGVGHPIRTIGVPIGLGDLGPAAPVDPHHAGEAFRLRRGVDQILEGQHGAEPSNPRGPGS